MKNLNTLNVGIGWAAIPLLLLVVGPPAAAQNIAAGDDVWNTPGGGGTYFTMPGADLDTVCGIAGHSDTTVVLNGKNLPGQGDGDILISRLGTAVFPPGNNVSATVNIQAKNLSFVSSLPVSTLCGNLTFTVGLDGGQANQPVTQMTINRDDSLGGSFSATIGLNVVFTATNSAGQPVGPPLYYSPTLPDPGGTPWAYNPPQGPLNPNAPWFPGVTKTGQPVSVTRFYDPAMGIPASHQYKPPKPLKPCRVAVEPQEAVTPGSTETSAARPGPVNAVAVPCPDSD